MRPYRHRAATAGSLTLAWALVALSLASAKPGHSQDMACEGALDGGDALPSVLAAVPKYGGTYVLAYLEERADVVVDLASASDFSFATYAGSPAQAIGTETLGREPMSVAYDPTQPAKLVDDVLAGSIDGAILWAPLAGLAAGILDFDYALSLKTLGLPSAPPPFALGAAPAEDQAACADEIRGLLEGYGVIAAEQLVPLDIKTLLALGPLPRDHDQAAAGDSLYATHCARCHGPEGVAATGALAPVDLVRSVRRFSWPGFLYIVLNGRQQNGMPGFRGSLERGQVERIYQYVRERAQGTIQPTAAAFETAAAGPLADPPAEGASSSQEIDR
jgi:mono/diheme cytochrome c family protein